MKRFDKEQPFNFTIELSAHVPHTDYDEAMRKIIDEVNKLNGGNVKIKKIEGSHSTIVL